MFNVYARDLVSYALADVMEIGVADLCDFLQCYLILSLFTDEDDLVTDSHAGYAGDVHHDLVHGDAADHGGPLSADEDKRSI